MSRPRPRTPAPATAPGATTPTGRTAAGAVTPDTAAAQVMTVLPGVMDAMRHAMRAQLDGPDGAPAQPGGALTVPQFRGLNYIDRCPGASVSALAAFLGVTLATASAMADRLVRAGYLQSSGSATDRRRAELRLQDAGKAVLERMRRQTQADLSRALRGRSAQELAALMAGLSVLDAAFAEVHVP